MPESQIPSEPPSDAMQYFTYAHLPPHIQPVSKAFAELASKIETSMTWSPQKDLCMQKLLEAKDCAVRAALKT